MMATIRVDRDLCTRCGICSEVCPSRIIDPAGGADVPEVAEEKEGLCIQCGHCEAYCPSDALVLNIRPDEKEMLPSGAGTLSPGDLGYYIKMRRSVRHYTGEPVSRETITEVLDIARYAPSGCNGQPVEWIVVHDPAKVHEVARLTIDWMRSIQNRDHPMSGIVHGLISAWDAGHDVICRGAPHLLVAHIPEGNQMAVFDAIIALAHFDLAAPAFGIGTCWAGFVAEAVREYEPLRQELNLPDERELAYAMMFGHPQYRVHAIPGRKPLAVTWI